MSQMQLLKLFISERLSVAAEEIFAAVYRTITEFEHDGDPHGAKDESSEADGPPVFIDAHKQKLWPEQSPESFHDTRETEEDTALLVPDPPLIKQEDPEPWSSSEEQQLLTVEESDSRTMEEDFKPLPDTSPEHIKVEINSQSVSKCWTLLSDCSVALNEIGPELGLQTLTGSSSSRGVTVSCIESSMQTEVGNPYSPALTNNQTKRKRKDKSRCCHASSEELSQSSHFDKHTQANIGEKTFVCNVCGKHLRHGKSIAPHMMIHKEEKPYCCKICGKGFRHTGNLNVHIRTHTGEKPFICPVCGKKFSRNYLMTKHMAVHTV